MRKQRLGLVQTADQLRFCYIAILQASIPESDREEEEEEEVQESDSEEEGVGLEGGALPWQPMCNQNDDGHNFCPFVVEYIIGIHEVCVLYKGVCLM